MSDPIVVAKPQGSGLIRSKIIAAVATITVAAGGAFGAAFFGLPIPFLLGSMLACIFASLSGLKLYLPDPLRNGIFIMLGVQAGSGVRPETLSQLAAWPVSFMLLFAMLIAVTGLTYLLLRMVFRWDAQTAFFSSLPGALSFVLAAAGETRADMVKITVIQTVRLLLLIGLLAPVLNILGQSAPHAVAGLREAMTLQDVLFLLIAGSLGAWLGFRSRLPGGMMLGALLASATVYGCGLVTMRFPVQATDFGMIILGVLIGSRLDVRHRGALLRYLPAALSAFVIGTLAAALICALVWWLTALHPAQVALAFAPGALEALTVIAFSLGVDPAYVASHHVMRFMMIALAVPVLARSLRKKSA